MKTLTTISAAIILLCNPSVTAQETNSKNELIRTSTIQPDELLNGSGAYEFQLREIIPLANSEGYDSVRISPVGKEEFVYPPVKAYSYSFSEINQIQLKENGILNPKTNVFEYVPVSIEFKVQKKNGKEEIIWIDLDELKEKLKKEDLLPEDLISTRQYNGYYHCN